MHSILKNLMPFLLLGMLFIPSAHAEYNPLLDDFAHMMTLEQVETVIANGVDIHETSGCGATALFHAMQHDNQPEIIQLLINHGLDVHTRLSGSCSIIGHTPLFFGLHRGLGGGIINKSLPEKIEILLKNGALVNQIYTIPPSGDGDDRHHTETSYVIDRCVIEEEQPLKLLKLLVKYGADIHNIKSIDIPDLNLMEHIKRIGSQYPNCRKIYDFLVKQRESKQ